MFRLPVLFLLLATFTVAQATDAPEDVQTVFSKAVQLLNAGHYAEAVPLLEDVTRRAPDRPGGFMNLGLAATESGDHHLALQAWSRYHELVPSDTKAFGKIIPCDQGRGRSIGGGRHALTYSHFGASGLDARSTRRRFIARKPGDAQDSHPRYH